MAFTEDEKSRIMDYLGYPKQRALEQSFQTSYAISNAATLQYLFDAWQRIDLDGETRVRECLAQLSCIDREIIAMRGNAGVEGAGEVKLDAAKGRLHLKKDRADYIRRLCDNLGVPPNPASEQHRGRVVHT